MHCQKSHHVSTAHMKLSSAHCTASRNETWSVHNDSTRRPAVVGLIKGLGCSEGCSPHGCYIHQWC
jgi:hypothetical protein